MKVVITGGAGGAGKACTAELLDRGHHVRCIDLLEGANPKAENLVVDVMDLPAVEEAVDGFDAVLHLAAIPAPRPRPEWPEVWRVNTISTYNVFEAAATGPRSRSPWRPATSGWSRPASSTAATRTPAAWTSSRS